MEQCGWAKKHFTVEIPNLTLTFLFSFKTPLIQKQPHPVCFFFFLFTVLLALFVCGGWLHLYHTVGIGAGCVSMTKALKH